MERDIGDSGLRPPRRQGAEQLRQARRQDGLCSPLAHQLPWIEVEVDQPALPIIHTDGLHLPELVLEQGRHITGTGPEEPRRWAAQLYRQGLESPRAVGSVQVGRQRVARELAGFLQTEQQVPQHVLLDRRGLTEGEAKPLGQ